MSPVSWPSPQPWPQDVSSEAQPRKVRRVIRPHPQDQQVTQDQQQVQVALPRFELPPIFYEDPKKLTFFLNHVWAHLDRYAYAYLDGDMMVNAVVANLEGEAADWVTNLHDEGAPELNINLFMEN
ncbi:hypothetical protein NXF25_008616 [Crotalus adamanteus]|uniref:DUF4939 domain-containing protein n=1 Tax=Crotalus adamanteus TaxID=8729 RepID=A0AAW1BNU1_CROAD